MTTQGFACPRCHHVNHPDQPAGQERGWCAQCRDWTGGGARLVGGALHGTDMAVRGACMPATLLDADPDGPYRRTGHRHVTGALVYVARVAEVRLHKLRFAVPLPPGGETDWQMMGRYGALYSAQLDRWSGGLAAAGWQPVDGVQLAYVAGTRGPVAMLSGLAWRPLPPPVVAGDAVGAHAAVGDVPAG